MKDLIEALTIFAKYQKDTRYPTNCSNYKLAIMGVGVEDISEEDKKRLYELSFAWNEFKEYWFSFRFGSE